MATCAGRGAAGRMQSPWGRNALARLSTQLPRALVVGTVPRVTEVALSVGLTVVITTITRVAEVANARGDVIVIAGGSSRCDAGGGDDVHRGQTHSAHR